MANRAWGDEDDDELPQNTESEVDANGMKEVVEYSLTPTGQRKKVTKKIKVITHVERISKRRIERQKRLRGHRFGDATDTADDSNVTITDYNEVRTKRPHALVVAQRFEISPLSRSRPQCKIENPRDADKVEEVPAGMNKVRAARARERESTQLSRATHVSVPARPLAGARGLR